jgi:hypothetical protein
MPDLERELQALADRRSVEATTDFDTVLTVAASRRRGRTAVFSVAAAVVAMVAVVAVTPWNSSETTPPPAATEQYSVTVAPDTARPGATVALTFPTAPGRGIAFQLAKESEPAKVLYYLTSDWGEPGKHKPTWWAYVGRGGWEDVGIGGPGPDRVVVPDIAEDGTYLLCTANAPDQACGLLTVRR